MVMISLYRLFWPFSLFIILDLPDLLHIFLVCYKITFPHQFQLEYDYFANYRDSSKRAERKWMHINVNCISISQKTNYRYTFIYTSRFLSKMKSLHPVSLSEFWCTLLQFQLTPIRPFADFASSHQGSGHFRDQLHPSNLLPDYIKLKI